jgi:hypothetical protein
MLAAPHHPTPNQTNSLSLTHAAVKNLHFLQKLKKGKRIRTTQTTKQLSLSHAAVRNLHFLQKLKNGKGSKINVGGYFFIIAIKQMYTLHA